MEGLSRSPTDVAEIHGSMHNTWRCSPFNHSSKSSFNLYEEANVYNRSGKGTPRRKTKKVHKSGGTDDKKLQTSLKKLNVQPIQAIEEVNMFKSDGNVIHFSAPKGTLLADSLHGRASCRQQTLHTCSCIDLDILAILNMAADIIQYMHRSLRTPLHYTVMAKTRS